jgi:anionic cell wall polymer biosynthesis LytR-Cps2A-Psr (LCP) family protein
MVLLAVKEKALSLGALSNPIKIFQILDSLGRNVRTDIGVGEIKDLVAMVDDLDSKDIVHKIFDTTPEGLLYSSQNENGAYILLPVGDNFSKIKEACKNIFD